MLAILSYINPALADSLCIFSTAGALPRWTAHPTQPPCFIALFAGCPRQSLFLINLLSRHSLASFCLARHAVIVVDLDDIVDDKDDEARKYKL